MARQNRWLVGSLLAGLILCGQALAEEAQPEEKELAQTQQEMDQELAKTGQEKQAENLAQKYNVEPQTIQRMRDQRQGWGEISIQLALAQQLSRTDPGKYPTTADALKRVEGLRGEGKGYGVISKELGFKLGPVVSDVKRSRDTLRAASRVERPERADRPERPERPEKFSRPDKPGKPDRS